MLYVLIMIAIYFSADKTGRDLAKVHLSQLAGAYILKLPESAGIDFVDSSNLVTQVTNYKHLFSSDETFFIIRKFPNTETFTVLRIPRSDSLVLANIRMEK